MKILINIRIICFCTCRFTTCVSFLAALGSCAGQKKVDRTPWSRQLQDQPNPTAPDRFPSPGLPEARYGEEEYVEAVEKDYNTPLQDRDYNSPVHERDYKVGKPECHPQTITKYRTVFKDRKANVFNKVGGDVRKCNT